MRAVLSLLAVVSLCVLSGCGGGSAATGSTGPASTSTMLTVTPNPAVAGATVTLTANVGYSSTTPPAPPTGIVTFLDGTTTLGTANLANGVATFTTTTLAAATHSLTASYAGSTGADASLSTAVPLVITAAPPASTSLALMVSPNPATAGAPVMLTATISSAAGVPTGSITFLDGATSIGTGTLSNGVASFTISTFAAGTHSLTASFAGTTSYAASTSAAVSLVVNAPAPAATTTVLTATPNPVAAGANAVLTATVTSASGTPTGSVAFFDGATSIGTMTLTNGVASFTTSTLSAGTTHSVTAVYAGTTSFATSTSAAVSLVVNAAINANGTFSFATPHQTIMGFGGAQAFYSNYLDSHPNESQIMTALFDPVAGLGITFLRLENNYYEFNGTNATTFDPDNTKIVTATTAALGTAPTILMSSWTPPATLKSNNSVNGCTGVTNGNCTSGFGTLNQVSGAYNYSGFGQFWLSSLQAYAALGVTPNYISIQNEPDFPATYVACLFNPTEAPATLYGSTPTSYASYGKAFDATYQAINASGALTSIPQMIGPEAFSLFDVQPLLTEVPANELAAVAHHLYNVSSYGGSPATQISPMTTLDSDYPNPALKFETEYFQTPGFYNAIDIHNALTVANDNVYLYWGLAWPSTLTNGISSDQQGLLYIDNPFNAQSTWAFPNGWTYNDSYYTLKHYSYFIRPGYVRYDATISNTDEDISVYQSPDMKTTVMVILNTSTTATDTVGLDLSSITYTNSSVYRSSFATPITSTTAERWNNLGAYNSQGITMAPQSEVTVVLTQ
jgi:O-glycosyl hydrolase